MDINISDLFFYSDHKYCFNSSDTDDPFYPDLEREAEAFLCSLSRLCVPFLPTVAELVKDFKDRL